MANLNLSIKNQGKEFSQILALHRAGLLTEKNIKKYLKSAEAKEVARALMHGKPGSVNLKDLSQRSLYKAVDKLA